MRRIRINFILALINEVNKLVIRYQGYEQARSFLSEAQKYYTD
jgi:hypothetical protein